MQENHVEATDEEAETKEPPQRHACMSLRNRKLAVYVESRYLLFRLPHLVALNDNTMVLNLYSSEGSRILSSNSASTLRTGVTVAVEPIEPQSGYVARLTLSQHLLENGVRFLCHRDSGRHLSCVQGRVEDARFDHLFYASGFTVSNSIAQPGLDCRPVTDPSWSASSSSALQMQFVLTFRPDLMRHSNVSKQGSIMIYHGEHIVTMTLESVAASRHAE